MFILFMFILLYYWGFEASSLIHIPITDFYVIFLVCFHLKGIYDFIIFCSGITVITLSTLKIAFWVTVKRQSGFPGGSVVKNPPAKQATPVWSLCQEDPLEEQMATHSSIFAWEIPWTEEPGGLQCMGVAKESFTP